LGVKPHLPAADGYRNCDHFPHVMTSRSSFRLKPEATRSNLFGVVPWLPLSGGRLRPSPVFPLEPARHTQWFYSMF
jgi:hypothetical protein